MYSQTIAYGLFFARMRKGGHFSRKGAASEIPHSIGILREIFDYISLGGLSTQVKWIVDEISDVLASVNVKDILSVNPDPFFPSYEKFLTVYDPIAKRRRGVFHTPEPVVSYIVRSLQIILKAHFHLPEGLAGGTLTFLTQAVKEAVKEFTTNYGDGGKGKFIFAEFLCF